MKSAPGALIALINSSNTFFVSDLYDIFLASGDVLRLCNADRPIDYPITGTVILDLAGALFPGRFLPFGFQRAGIQWTSVPAVQSLDVKMLVTQDVLINGKPIAQAAHEGIFDGARIKLYRAFFDKNLALVDVLFHFEGTVANVEPTSSEVRLVVKSELDRLNIKLPKHLFQPMCSNVFLDSGCDPNPPGTLRATVSSTGTLAGVPTRFVVGYTAAVALNFFQLGIIKMTSGVCDGQIRAIRSDVNSGPLHNITLAIPFTEPPLAGDTFLIRRGCTRTLTQCQAYADQSRFRGFPYVPRPEDVR